MLGYSSTVETFGIPIGALIVIHDCLDFRLHNLSFLLFERMRIQNIPCLEKDDESKIKMNSTHDCKVIAISLSVTNELLRHVSAL